MKIGTHQLKTYTHNEYHQEYAATMYNGWQRRWNQTLSPRIVILSGKFLKRPEHRLTLKDSCEGEIVMQHYQNERPLNAIKYWQPQNSLAGSVG